jgi:solute carrier family 13 (sodium-dependent dicarboxylate transporter), member 2/3/5
VNESNEREMTRPNPPASEDVASAEPGRGAFDRHRVAAGLFVGPLLFLLILFWPGATLPQQALTLGAIMALMIVFWVTEALPLAVTALLGPTLAVVMGVASARVAFAPFADPIIFLFIGSFILAEAMFVHGLDRRIAFTALSSRWIGSSALRLGIAYASVTALLSMWMSNTATTAMMFPLGLAVLGELGRDRLTDATFRQYALAMMLMTSFAASIGGMGTPVGTPPNLIGIGLLRDLAGINISFAAWMLLGVPIVVITMGGLIVTLLYPRARRIQLNAATTEIVRRALVELGPLGRGERNVVAAFVVTMFLWVMPGILQAWLGQTHPIVQRVNALVPEAIAAMIGALLLFLLPRDWAARRFTMTWAQASRIDWGIVLLFGGGLAMGQLADATGLSRSLGAWVAGQFPEAGTVGLTLVFTGAAIVLSEAASNTAAANIVVPMAIAVSQAAGISPLEPALGATLGASMGFMMPVSTPPNAIVYSSGHIPIAAMVRHGFVLDLFGFVVIVVAVLLGSRLLT